MLRLAALPLELQLPPELLPPEPVPPEPVPPELLPPPPRLLRRCRPALPSPQQSAVPSRARAALPP